MPQFISIGQAVSILSISRPTIQRKLKDGIIPHIRLGRRILIPSEFFTQLNDKAMKTCPNTEG